MLGAQRARRTVKTWRDGVEGKSVAWRVSMFRWPFRQAKATGSGDTRSAVLVAVSCVIGGSCGLQLSKLKLQR